MMRIERLAPKIYALIGDTSTEVASVMIRIQENYESPKFRNKVFTLQEFIPWYMEKRGKDTFTYFNDWAGFNVPGHIVRRFMNGKFNPLRPQEQWLVDQIRELDIKDKFYLLGFAEGDARVRKHEMAHGLFYTSRKYKQEVLKAMEGHSTVEKIGVFLDHLRQTGYHDEVLVDEYHAWTLTDGEYLKKLGIWNAELDILKAKLEDIFSRYAVEEK